MPYPASILYFCATPLPNPSHPKSAACSREKQAKQELEKAAQLAAAENIYRRVEKPKIDYPAAFYAIAQQHLAMMQNESKFLKSSAGQR